MAALQEKFDEERAMLLQKLAEQRQEISQIHANETSALQAQLGFKRKKNIKVFWQKQYNNW